MKTPQKKKGHELLKAALVGVLCRENERNAAIEFFELFKTAWEFFQENHSYSVVLSTNGYCPKTDAKVVILFSSSSLSFDENNSISVEPIKEEVFLDIEGQDLPIYGNVASINSQGIPLLKSKGKGQTIGAYFQKGSQAVWRIGYDLFQEVIYLLSQGQTPANSLVPALEIQISILRKWLLATGLTFVEIPPVPSNYDFICCLTHDVDFAGIRRHRFDRTVIGFLFRALLVSLTDVLRGRCSLEKLFANWKAVLILPAIYLGLKSDFWIQFDKYREIEQDLTSTYFFLPYKGRPGKDKCGHVHLSRASKYDVEDVKPHIKNLVASGCEIALHGIDAWHDLTRGKEEVHRISSASGIPCRGVRMHWLYFDKGSARILDEIGLNYDSTLGYNDAVGYWAGTVQAFCPPDVNQLLELPLNIQDSALFYKGRMGLYEKEAYSFFQSIIKNNLKYGGALIINWHNRSLGPERLWGDFYQRILTEIRRNRVWFASCTEAVKWFNKRRKVKFLLQDNICDKVGAFRFLLNYPERDAMPNLLVRIHKPQTDFRIDSRTLLFRHIDEICVEEFTLDER